MASGSYLGGHKREAVQAAVKVALDAEPRSCGVTDVKMDRKEKRKSQGVIAVVGCDQSDFPEKRGKKGLGFGTSILQHLPGDGKSLGGI